MPLVCAAVLYLFYSLYFFLFTSLAGATPGMQIRGLTAVRLDGSLPDTSSCSGAVLVTCFRARP